MAISLKLYFSDIKIDFWYIKDWNGQMQTAKVISWATNDVGSSKTFYTFIIGKVFWDTSLLLREEMGIEKLCHILK